MKDLLYRLYARRLRARLDPAAIPRHVAIVMDGNRRWARQMGYANPSIGHRYGAEHVDEVLDWCAQLGIPHVTVYVCSSDNLRKRDSDEVSHLMAMIEEVVAERLRRPEGQWRLHVAGRLDDLPDLTRHALKRAAEETRERQAPFDLTIAIGYDGREEIVDAVRSLLDARSRAGLTTAELAAQLSMEDIAAHLYTTGQPDPDLVIRTSGELRMSGFLLWQAAYSELYFCDVYWPGFRYVDFLRALRSYAARHRRFGA
jgi:short-chain Z-isoprenyl diphosphate synthase